MGNSGVLVGFIISGVVLVLGVILLIFSIKKTKKNKKFIGGIIGGGFMIGVGVLLALYFLMVLLLVSAIDNFPAESTYRALLSYEYHTSDGYCFQRNKIAKKGLSGEAIDYDEAKEVSDMIYSIHRVTNGGTEDSVSVHDDVEVYCFQNTVSNSQGEKYTYYCEVISRATDEDLIGIHYIRVEKDGKLVKELGAKPVFD